MKDHYKSKILQNIPFLVKLILFTFISEELVSIDIFSTSLKVGIEETYVFND